LIIIIKSLSARVMNDCCDLQLPMQLVSITTNVVSLNPTHNEVYSILHYVIKFVSNLRYISDFHQVLRFPPSINLAATI